MADFPINRYLMADNSCKLGTLREISSHSYHELKFFLMKSREAFYREVFRSILYFYTCVVKNYIGLVAAIDTNNQLGPDSDCLAD